MVLVVDDDESARQTICEMLEGEGYDVLVAEHGHAALELLANEQPDLIFLDLMMPVMDGFDFLAELRKEPAHREIPVVVVTAADLTAEDHRRLNGGIEALLHKSACGREELLDALRELVGRYASKRSPEVIRR